MQPSPDGKLFATGSADKSVRIWDAEKRTLLKVLLVSPCVCFCVGVGVGVCEFLCT